MAPTIHAITAFDGLFNMYFLNSAFFGWRDSSIPESHNIGNLPFGREGVNTYWFRYRACRGGVCPGLSGSLGAVSDGVGGCAEHGRQGGEVRGLG